MIDVTRVTFCDGVPAMLLKPYMQIRELTKTDAIEYRTLRLRALKEHPMAFSSSYDDQRDWRLDIFAERLSETPGSGDSFVLGCFADAKLIGTIGFFREREPKCAHLRMIGGMHVAAEQQGNGYGRTLLKQALERARQLPGLKLVQLSVTTTNEPAKTLYASFGFEIYGRAPQAMFVDGEYIDEYLMALKVG